jgi:hypothetical protein
VPIATAVANRQAARTRIDLHVEGHLHDGCRSRRADVQHHLVGARAAATLRRRAPCITGHGWNRGTSPSLGAGPWAAGVTVNRPEKLNALSATSPGRRRPRWLSFGKISKWRW